MVASSPNKSLQLTRLCAPLSSKPLGGLSHRCRLLLALIVLGQISDSVLARARPPKVWQAPAGFKVIRDTEMRIEFAYPRTWQFVLDCDRDVTFSCHIRIIPPADSVPDPGDEPLVPFRSIEISVHAYSEGKGICETPTQGVLDAGELVVGGRSPGVIRATSRKTYSRSEYLGLGDGAEACLHDIAKRRMAIITMEPPADPTDPALLEIVRSFRFLDDRR